MSQLCLRHFSPRTNTALLSVITKLELELWSFVSKGMISCECSPEFTSSMLILSSIGIRCLILRQCNLVCSEFTVLTIAAQVMPSFPVNSLVTIPNLHNTCFENLSYTITTSPILTNFSVDDLSLEEYTLLKLKGYWFRHCLVKWLSRLKWCLALLVKLLLVLNTL